MTTSRRLLLAAAGLAFGAATAAANYGLLPGGPYTAKILSSQWGWLAAAFAVAWLGTTWRASTELGLTFLLPAVAAYYIADSVNGAYSGVEPVDVESTGLGSASGFDGISLVGDLIVYSVLSAAAAAAFALLVVVIRNGRKPAAVAAALALPCYLTYVGFDTAGYSYDDPAMRAVALSVGIISAITAVGIAGSALFRRSAEPPAPHVAR